MVNYYKKKMDAAYQQWQEAIESGDKPKEDKFMNDYLNYKELYDSRLKVVGGNHG